MDITKWDKEMIETLLTIMLIFVLFFYTIMWEIYKWGLPIYQEWQDKKVKAKQPQAPVPTVNTPDNIIRVGQSEWIRKSPLTINYPPSFTEQQVFMCEVLIQKPDISTFQMQQLLYPGSTRGGLTTKLTPHMDLSRMWLLAKFRTLRESGVDLNTEIYIKVEAPIEVETIPTLPLPKKYFFRGPLLRRLEVLMGRVFRELGYIRK